MTTPDPLSLARTAVDAVTAVPGVRRVTDARSAIATYGPGERVRGVRVVRGDGGWTVHARVVAAYGQHLPGLAGSVRSAIHDALPVPLTRIDVTVADVEVARAPSSR